MKSQGINKVKCYYNSENNHYRNLDDVLEKGLAEMQENTECNSALKTFLNIEIIDQYKNENTDLVKCTKAGFENHSHPIGLIATDSHAYTVYADLFNLVIEKHHNFGNELVHTALDWGTHTFESLDSDYIISMQFMCRRSLDSFPFLPSISEEQLIELSCKVFL